MLRFIKNTIVLGIVASSVGATAFAITSSTERNETISQAYSDIDENMAENQKKISNMYSDMKSYNNTIDSNNKALLEGGAQYQHNGQQGLNFDLDENYYNPNGYVGSGFDVDNVLQQSEEMQSGGMEREGINQPLVLVSFSMPETTIKRLVEQMREVKGSLVFRGFKDDNLKSMMTKVNELGIERGSIVIDPTLFKRFNVQQVPTFILPGSTITTCSEEQCETPKHIKVTGDVSLDYVLDLVERTGSDEDKLIVRNIK